MQRLLLALLMGALGVALSSLIVWKVADAWSSFSERWLVLALVMPVFGILAGCGLAEKLSGGGADWFIRNRLTRLGYALLAGVFSALGGYLAFIITARTWFADRVEPASAGFFHQVLHPSTLPTFYKNSAHGFSNEQHWWLMAGIGLLVGIWVTYSALGRRWNQ